MSRTARATVRETAVVLLAGAAAGTAVWLLFLLGSYRARADLCVVTGLVVAAGWLLLRSTLPPPEAPAEFAPPREAPGDGFEELASLEHSLSWGSVDADRFGRRVRPLIAGLVADRLRTRRGIDPRHQPDQARRIVGESLWELMTGPPPTRCPTRAELTSLVEAIERI
jgi:hypothetical protein